MFFPYVFSFVAFNWKPIFILFAQNGSALTRIQLFEDRTSLLTLVVYPIVLGLMLTIVLPYLKAGLGLLMEPARKHKRKADDKADQDIEKVRLNGEVEITSLKLKIAEGNKAADIVLSTIQSETIKQTTEEALIKNDSSVPDGPVNDEMSRVEGYDWLQENSYDDYQFAMSEAHYHSKLLLIISHDPNSGSSVQIEDAANSFFRFQNTRKLVQENLIIYLTDLSKKESDRSLFKMDQVVGPEYALFDFDGEFISRGRLYVSSPGDPVSIDGLEQVEHMLSYRAK